MTPVEVLIAMAKAGTISPSEFYDKMMAQGIMPTEAQTMLSNAAGGSAEGLDPSLESARSQPLEPSAYNYAPAQTATVMRDEYAPRETIMDKIRRGPAAQAIEIARAKIEGREPNFNVGNGPGASPTGQSSPAAYSSMQPAPAPVPAQVPAATPQQAQADQAPATATGFNPEMAGPSPGYDDPNAMTPAIEQAVAMAKQRMQRAPAQSVASEQTRPSSSGPFMDPLTREMVGSAAPSAAPQSASSLAQIIRGRFGEAAREDANRLTAAQEERDRVGGGMAKGGSVSGGGKDAAIHKALEIIHHLISNR